MYKVYWIKYSEYNDPNKEGYIGITSQDIEKRFYNHKFNRKNKLLANRCKKENVELICLHENLSKEEARILEEKYRPSENIGWNINKGGDLPPSRKGKQSPKSLLKGDDRTEKQKIGSKKRSEKIKGNNFSGMRKNRVDHSKPCENCKKIFNPGYEIRKKYCCIKCAVEKRNQSQDYRNKLKEATSKRWQNTEYKMKVSELIRKSLNGRFNFT
jgi:predicted GIY-YIG superfamily endonuclease